MRTSLRKVGSLMETIYFFPPKSFHVTRNYTFRLEHCSKQIQSQNETDNPLYRIRPCITQSGKVNGMYTRGWVVENISCIHKITKKYTRLYSLQKPMQLWNVFTPCTGRDQSETKCTLARNEMACKIRCLSIEGNVASRSGLPPVLKLRNLVISLLHTEGSIRQLDGKPEVSLSWGEEEWTRKLYQRQHLISYWSLYNQRLMVANVQTN